MSMLTEFLGRMLVSRTSTGEFDSIPLFLVHNFHRMHRPRSGGGGDSKIALFVVIPKRTHCLFMTIDSPLSATNVKFSCFSFKGQFTISIISSLPLVFNHNKIHKQYFHIIHRYHWQRLALIAGIQYLGY